MSKALRLDKQFGLWFTFISVATFFLRKINSNSNLYYFFHKYKYKLVSKYIGQKYSYLIEKYKKIDEIYCGEGVSDYIWIFWWQGIDNSPTIVKRCVEKIKETEKSKKIIIIDKDNYNNYIDISPEILKKVNNGNFTLTYFSDIIRLSLLAKYGGLWIDPTCYITELPIIEKTNFITVKHGLFNTWHVSRGRWSSFFIGCSKNNPAICLVRDILLQNILETDSLMAYLFLDSALSVAYDNLPGFTNEVDKLQVNNINVFKMEKQLNDLYSKDYLIPEKVNKLSYKEKHVSSKNNKLTIYGALINNKL